MSAFAGKYKWNFLAIVCHRISFIALDVVAFAFVFKILLIRPTNIKSIKHTKALFCLRQIWIWTFSEVLLLYYYCGGGRIIPIRAALLSLPLCWVQIKVNYSVSAPHKLTIHGLSPKCYIYTCLSSDTVNTAGFDGCVWLLFESICH